MHFLRMHVWGLVGGQQAILFAYKFSHMQGYFCVPNLPPVEGMLWYVCAQERRRSEAFLEFVLTYYVDDPF